MINSLREKSKNEINHWRKFRDDVDKFWLHHTPAGQARINHRSKLISEYLGKAEGLKVLEVGAGNGWYSLAFSRNNWDLTISDLSKDLLKIAKGKIGINKKINFAVADVYKLPFKKNSFDAVIGSSILHHIELNSALPEIFRVLKPGGKIAFCEPNMLNPQIAIQKNIPYFKKKAGDSPDETAYFKWQLRNKILRNGFINVNIYPIDFLHPKTPTAMLSKVERLSRILEKVPLVREIAGSLFITAIKP